MYVKKCPSNIQCQDTNSQHLEHESPPITTRPGLLPNVHFYCEKSPLGSYSSQRPFQFGFAEEGRNRGRSFNKESTLNIKKNRWLEAEEAEAEAEAAEDEDEDDWKRFLLSRKTNFLK